MTTPTYCTLEGNPSSGVAPYRPSVDDMGGAAFVDDDTPGYAPVPEQQVCAPDINQMQNLLVRACRMLPAASFYIHRSGSTVELLGFKALNDRLLATDVVCSVAVEYGASGIVRIQCPVGRLPPAVVPPRISLVHSLNVFGIAIPAQYTDVDYSVITIDCYDTNIDPITSFYARIDIDGEGNFAPSV